MNELRCYTWTLYQLSPIQQGIQAGHAAVELTRRGHDLTIEWAKDWKTMVLLNGGDLNELHTTYGFFETAHNPFPWAAFYESEESLGGLMTSIAMILPDRIFGTAENMRKLKAGFQIAHFGFTEWEWELMERLAASSLAR